MTAITFGSIATKTRYYISVDLGQAADYTALTITAYNQLKDRYEVRYLHRFPLNTSYPAIIKSIQTVHSKPEMFGAEVILDGTGVGRAVVDMFRDAGVDVTPITITGGNTISREQGYLRVPKRDLIGMLVSVFQGKRIVVPRELPFIKELINEMHNFKLKISSKGHDTYESWRESDHDDIVLSLAMGIWYAERFGERVARNQPVMMAGGIDGVSEGMGIGGGCL